MTREFVGFGKPKRTSEPVRCISCGEQYPEHEIKLIHAGRTEMGDFWNSKCPECGTINAMQEEYAQMSDAEFEDKQQEWPPSR